MHWLPHLLAMFQFMLFRWSLPGLSSFSLFHILCLAPWRTIVSFLLFPTCTRTYPIVAPYLRFQWLGGYLSRRLSVMVVRFTASVLDFAEVNAVPSWFSPSFTIFFHTASCQLKRPYACYKVAEMCAGAAFQLWVFWHLLFRCRRIFLNQLALTQHNRTSDYK